MKAIPITTAKKNTVDLPIGNRVYPVALSLHILDMIQSEFGSLQEAIDKSNDVTVMARLIYLLIDDAVFCHNEEIDEEAEKWKPLSEEYIARKISVQDLVDLNPLLVKCFLGSLPDSEPINGEEIPDEALEVLSDIPVTEKN
jgi:hypothetical protein